MTRTSFLLTVCFLLIGCALPMHATTTCTYNFQSGTGNSFIHFCVTVNGNISTITTPDGDQQLASAGEGYGICGVNNPTRYEDYGTSDTGNWQAPSLVSKTGSAVKIARTTSDGHWTLTQTITKVPKTTSITVVMALTNNQSISDGAFLVRYADPEPEGQLSDSAEYLPTINTVSAVEVNVTTDDGNSWLPGLQLQNVGTPGFGFWQGYVQDVPTGPNACAFSGFAARLGGVRFISGTSIEMVYVDAIPAHKTKTVTLSYHGF